MRQELAQSIARDVLIWLAGQEDLLPVFLGATGADPTQIRTAAEDPEFLGSVLDFLLLDDAWVVQFCDANDLAYDKPMIARRVLPGGATVDWT